MQLPAQTCEHLFLTGATGVLGAHLLKEFLETTDADIYCLVRAESASQAKARLHGFLKVYDPNDLLRFEFDSRVKPVLGDILSPQLGLSDDAYQDLLGRVDLTIHSAAMTNLFASYGKIAPVNVDGTKRVIDFALATASKRLCYISTYTVMGDKTFDRDFIFREAHLDVGQGFEHMTYQKTKFECEVLVRAGEAQGLVWTIVRPGQIFGESTTGLYPQGQTNVSGLFYDIWKTVIETGVALYSDVFFDVTPVDYVSKATAFLAQSPEAIFGTYHLTNPDERTYTEIIKTIADLGYQIEMVPQEEYKRRLFARSIMVNGSEYKSYTTQAFKWWYRRESFDFSYSCRTTCELTRSVLEPRGIRCPKLDHRLLGTYIDRGIQLNYFPEASDMSRSQLRAVR